MTTPNTSRSTSNIKLTAPIDAKILFASDSVFEVLGYTPPEIKGNSFFDYFHEDEVKDAREFQRKEAAINGASSLKHYKLKHSNGNWVACECVFTIVEPIVVTCISLYLRDDGRPTEGSKSMSTTLPRSS